MRLCAFAVNKMKLSPELKAPSPKAWIDCVMNDFNSFLQDHADCERKASSMAMSFVAKFHDKPEIVPLLIETAIEELQHFEQVYQVMQNRGVHLRKDIPEDEYVNALLKYCRSDRDGRALDRMLLASIIECRGAERFKMVCDALQDEELKLFYRDLWTSEAKHGNIFVKMALQYFDENEIQKRLDYFVEKEAEVMLALPIRAALH